MTWRSWSKTQTFRPPDGTVQPSRQSAGVYPGAGVARGGQQGRLGVMHGGFGGTRSGGRTSSASKPSTVGDLGSRPSTMPTGTKPGSWTVGSQQPSRQETLLGSKLDYAAQQKAQADAIANRPYEDPMEHLARFLDAQYWFDLMGVQQERDASVNPLVAEIDSLTRRTDGRTMYDAMIERAERDHRFEARRTRGVASQQGSLRSGMTNRRYSELDDAFVDTRLNLLNSHGSNRVEQLEMQRAQVLQAYQQQQLALAFAAAQRRAAQGVDIGETNFNMNLLAGYGGAQ
jgi:hypothetical protein